MNIYISGLSYGTNDADLTNLFAEFGEVSSAFIYSDINIFLNCYNHHDHHRETVFQCEGVQRLLK